MLPPAHVHWLTEMSVVAFPVVFMSEYGMLSVGGRLNVADGEIMFSKRVKEGKKLTPKYTYVCKHKRVV